MNTPAAGERARTAVTGGGHPMIRPLDPRDAHHLAKLFGRLSPTSRHLRYLTPMITLPAGHLRHLAGHRFHAQEVGKAHAEQTRTADAEQFAAREAITVRAGLAGNGKHGRVLRETRYGHLARVRL